jgi:nucleoside-diphosphate-sugar epimerase
MQIAVTGATGFLGGYIVRQLAGAGHRLRCWHRSGSRREGLKDIDAIEWVPGELGDREAARRLVTGCEAVVHAALWRPGATFRGGEGDVEQFAAVNVIGSLQLIEAARAAAAQRFVFVSTCAVHEQILDDRPLDETHPLWPLSHYGAHKAAIEKFVHSYGLGQGYAICALRPTGIYGAARPLSDSKWYDLVHAVARGEPVQCTSGGKEVHAADVAKAIGLLLHADGIAGQAYNCYDMYISDYAVAHLARELSGSSSEIAGTRKSPRHEIVTDKLRRLGMQFGGPSLLRETISQLLAQPPSTTA